MGQQTGDTTHPGQHHSLPLEYICTGLVVRREGTDLFGAKARVEDGLHGEDDHTGRLGRGDDARYLRARARA